MAGYVRAVQRAPTRGAQRLFPAAPPERLAVLRVLVGLFAVVYLVSRAPIYLSLADAAPARYEPLGVLWWSTRPFSDGALHTLYAVAVVSGAGFVAGALFRLSGPVFALALLALSTYRSSWGQILWLENVMVLHVLVVGWSRSADALRWPRRRGDTPAASEAYGVPVRLAAVITVVTYLLAAQAKVRYGGWDWFATDSLRNHVAGTFVRAELLDAPASPIGRWLVQFGWLFPPMAIGSWLLELAAPVALLGGRRRDAWVVLTWGMHLAIALTMYVTFPYPLFLVAFAPFYDLEAVPRWLSGRRAARARSSGGGSGTAHRHP